MTFIEASTTSLQTLNRKRLIGLTVSHVETAQMLGAGQLTSTQTQLVNEVREMVHLPIFEIDTDLPRLSSTPEIQDQQKHINGLLSALLNAAQEDNRTTVQIIKKQIDLFLNPEAGNEPPTLLTPPGQHPPNH